MNQFNPGDWLFTTWGDVGDVALTAVGIYAALLLYARIAGLRTFSKMSSFDFAITVAIGSVVAGTILFDGPSLFRGVVALTTLFLIKMGVAWLRVKADRVCHYVDNEPLVLMTKEGVIAENLKRTQVTEGDLWAKLRAANVIEMAQVRAVVLETTGDISVLHAPPDGPALEDRILTGVRDADRVHTRGVAGEGRDG